jgi:uncharacterized protein (TIGR00297 family)
VNPPKLAWQSKLILLAVLPMAATGTLLACFANDRPIVGWTLGLSLFLGLVTWRLRAATAMAAATGVAITASLMFSTASPSYAPWRTALIPILAVSLMAFAATRVGRRKKEQMGTAEKRHGRAAAQVAANLGLAACAASSPVQIWLLDRPWLPPHSLLLAPTLAALAEAAADTVSSEIGQVLGGRPRLITTLRAVEPGRDGAISLAGSLAGMVAAVLVSACGSWALGGGGKLFGIGSAGGVFGLFFDSLLGATAEERGWLNNDAVNFLSTAAAAGFALALLAALR